ncbi:MAG: 4-(cytidine 5'-diphospho)-2-C-methyl-D-erythritol kinase, partial [Phycisphaerae bacterium]|nr:4-(cytidine 5'-diphospho)-2-C-methyl-D-erythritol kinase [Phycisphaerae bacterium]
MNALAIAAPAKLNLALRVGKPDGTGYHPLASWMCTIALFDNLSIVREGPPGLRFTCDDPALPRDAGNLVLRAARELLTDARLGYAALSITLRKRIPSAAGLGGGSSDAAATLLGLNRLFELGFGREKLALIASALGSDVPFFLYGPSAYCRGRGERVSPLPAPSLARWALLVLAPFGLSTADVYRRFDDMALGTAESPELAEAQKLPDFSSRELLNVLSNDLEPAAFSLAPALSDLHATIERHLGRPVRMSGSGSTLFTLFDDPDEANRAAQRARDTLFGPRFAVVTLAPEVSDVGDPL